MKPLPHRRSVGPTRRVGCSRPRRPLPADAGFSLIDVMVTMIIIGLVAGIAITGLTRMKASAETQSTRDDAIAVARAIETNYPNMDGYPADHSAVLANMTRYRLFMKDGNRVAAYQRYTAQPNQAEGFWLCIEHMRDWTSNNRRGYIVGGTAESYSTVISTNLERVTTARGSCPAAPAAIVPPSASPSPLPSASTSASPTATPTSATPTPTPTPTPTAPSATPTLRPAPTSCAGLAGNNSYVTNGNTSSGTVTVPANHYLVVCTSGTNAIVPQTIRIRIYPNGSSAPVVDRTHSQISSVTTHLALAGGTFRVDETCTTAGVTCNQRSVSLRWAPAY